MGLKDTVSLFLADGKQVAIESRSQPVEELVGAGNVVQHVDEAMAIAMSLKVEGPQDVPVFEVLNKDRAVLAELGRHQNRGHWI